MKWVPEADALGIPPHTPAVIPVFDPAAEFSLRKVAVTAPKKRGAQPANQNAAGRMSKYIRCKPVFLVPATAERFDGLSADERRVVVEAGLSAFAKSAQVG